MWSRSARANLDAHRVQPSCGAGVMGVRTADALAAARVVNVLGLDPSLTHTAGYHASFPAAVENFEITGDYELFPTMGQTPGGLRASRNNSEIAGGFRHGGENPGGSLLPEANPAGFRSSRENFAFAEVIRPFAITTKPKDHAHPLLRLRAIRDAFVRELETCEASARAAGDASPRGVSDETRGVILHAPLLVVEGYSYSSRHSHSHALGELGGMLRLVAFERGWTVVVVPPTVLKQYVTGKGVAPKETMMLECFKRWGYSATDNNDCDAYSLMRLGMDYVSWCHGGTNLSKRVTALLAKLEAWGPAVATERVATAPDPRQGRSGAIRSARSANRAGDRLCRSPC